MKSIKAYLSWLTLIPGIILIDIIFYIFGLFSRKLRHLYHDKFIRPLFEYEKLKEKLHLD